MSTEEHAREGVSRDAQEAALAAYAELHKLSLARILRDAGASGKDLRRPGIQALLAVVEAAEVGAVFVYRLDQLSRRTRDLLELVERFEEAGLALHSIDEHLPTQTAVGRFVLGTLASLAEMEPDLSVEHTREAPRHKAENGEWIGRVPLGYRLNAGRLVTDPEGHALPVFVHSHGAGDLNIPSVRAASLRGRIGLGSVGPRWSQCPIPP